MAELQRDAREVIIRRIAADDGSAYRAVRLRAFADAPTAFGTTHAEASARPLSWWVDRAQAAAEGIELTALFAQSGSEIVGLVGGSREPDSVELTSMWVAPEWRGRGIGRRLIDSVAAWASEQGVGELTLWVTEGNTYAITLYEAYGFALTGESQAHPSQEGLSEVEMRAAVK